MYEHFVGFKPNQTRKNIFDSVFHLLCLLSFITLNKSCEEIDFPVKRFLIMDEITLEYTSLYKIKKLKL